MIVWTKFTSLMYLFATSSKATLGHSQNQSIVVQFTKAGYWRSLFLNASPMGLMQSIMCMLARTLFIRKLYIASEVWITPAFVAAFDSLVFTCTHLQKKNFSEEYNLHLQIHRVCTNWQLLRCWACYWWFPRNFRRWFEYRWRETL